MNSLDATLEISVQVTIYSSGVQITSKLFSLVLKRSKTFLGLWWLIFGQNLNLISKTPVSIPGPSKFKRRRAATASCAHVF